MKARLKYLLHIHSHHTLYFIIGILLCVCTETAHSQSLQVSGTVTDANTGESLPGVNVVLKGSPTTGTFTSEDGTYQLNVPDENDTLKFSFVGYQSKTIPIEGRSTLDVQLTSKFLTGNDVVVVGYGTQRKSTLTGAISSVSSAELEETPVADMREAIQGKVSGVNVTTNGGPGVDPIVHIRGISSISYASDPLYVVDGMPVGSITGIDNKDIASVEVLKDASAAAIYGSRATNGVILITTKKGSRGNGVDVDFDSYVGVQSVWNKVDLLNTDQYIQYAKAIDGNAGLDVPERITDHLNEPIYKDANQTYAQTSTNWQDAYFRKGFLTNEHLALHGGNEDTRFYLSAGYVNQEGIAVGQKYQRGNFRINSEHDISDVFTFGENFYLSHAR